jgi:hypothetical protein
MIINLRKNVNWEKCKLRVFLHVITGTKIKIHKMKENIKL